MACFFDLMNIYVTESKIGAWVQEKAYNGKLDDKTLLKIISSVNLEIF
jgi:CRISPR/Cas system-associated endoribonuclease Cas2